MFFRMCLKDNKFIVRRILWAMSLLAFGTKSGKYWIIIYYNIGLCSYIFAVQKENTLGGYLY